MDTSKPPKKPTTPPEWIGVITLVILTIVVFLILWFVVKPKLFSSSSNVNVPNGLPTSTTCATSPAPTNLSATVGDFANPTFDAKWDPVLTATTPGNTVLGYNIYVSTIAGITLDNTKSAGFTASPTIRVKKSSTGPLVFGTTYHFKVQTVDTCGLGVLSTEEFTISI